MPEHNTYNVSCNASILPGGFFGGRGVEGERGTRNELKHIQSRHIQNPHFQRGTERIVECEFIWTPPYGAFFAHLINRAWFWLETLEKRVFRIREILLLNCLNVISLDESLYWARLNVENAKHRRSTAASKMFEDIYRKVTQLTEN